MKVDIWQAKNQKWETFPEDLLNLSLTLAVGGHGTMFPLVVVFGNVQRDFKIGRC